MTDSKTIRIEMALLLVWFAVNLIIGALTVHEYGMSVDELNNQRYAADTLDAYPSIFGIRYEPRYDSSYDGHGPAFVTIAAIFVGTIQAVFPNAFVPDLWHYAYFLTFPLAGLCLYWLTRRWFSIWTAWGILLLFNTQPLLQGHAFINPKDIPFMFFLTLSVLWGLRMADAAEGEFYLSMGKLARILRDNVQRADPNRRRRFLVYLTLAVATALTLVIFSQQINSLLGQAVTYFYDAESDSWAGRLFNSVSSPGVPAENYVNKALRLFQRVELGLLIAGLLFLVTYFGLLINNTTLSGFLAKMWAQRHRLAERIDVRIRRLDSPFGAGALKAWFAELFRALCSPHVLLAGVALGLATGIRAAGPLAGVIVISYLFAKVRSRAWATAIAYFLIAGIITYIAWPRLWDAPVQRYLEALGVISNFSTFPGRVLFNGRLYGARDLPYSYLPTLLNIQLTETLLLCTYLGLGLFVWRLLRGRLQTDLVLYLSLGFALPLFGLILLNPTLYHNFRQALFIVPAMLMLAAFPLEFALSKFSRSWVRVLLIAALAVPGVYSTVRLYPYEYVYYNSLVGGPAGAAYRYEMDYWRISLREVALELNEVAATGSIIVVTRSAGLLARYTRPDLVVDKPINSILDLEHGYDYIVHVTRGKSGDLYPEVESLIVIERDGAVLATAKYVKGISGR